MRRIFLISPVVATMLFMFAGCSGKKQAGEPQSDFAIERLDLALDSMRQHGGRVDSLPQRLLAPVRAIMMSEKINMSPDSFANLYVGAKVFEVFEPDVKKFLPDLNDVNRQTGAALGFLKTQGMKVPSRVAGYITPYNQSVVTVDSVMLIGLNHYLGADYEGYSGFDAYRRAMKTASRIPYDVTEAVLSAAHPYEATAYSTVLSRLLYEGAVMNAVMQAVPDASLSLALGMTPEQLKWCEDNEREIWHKLAGANLIYSTSALDADKLVAPSPSAAIVHPDAPGRVGRYIGYRIVSAALEKDGGLSLSRMLSPEFYNDATVLRRADYRP